MALLRVLPADPSTGRVRDIPLDRDAMTLGRGPECDVVLEDPSASRSHARLRRGPEGWMIEDLGSTYGTTVQGVVVRVHLLRPGDTIQVGGTRLCFLEAAEAPSKAPQPRARKRWLLGCAFGCLFPVTLATGLGIWLALRPGPEGTAALAAAAAFRQAAGQDARAAFAGALGQGLQARMREFDEAMWPTVDPDLGWRRFFATSLVAAGRPRAQHRPVLYYNPWADVGLITIWSPGGQVLDAQLIAGDCLRRGGSAPYGGRRGWLHQDAYGPVAVAALTAQSLRAFEDLMEDGRWTRGLEASTDAFRPGEPQTASRLACGLQFADLIRDLVAFVEPPGNPVQTGFIRLLEEGPAAVPRARGTPPASAAALRSMPHPAWASFRPAARVAAGDKVLVMAQDAAHPGRFLAAVFRVEGDQCVLERLDACSFQDWYGVRP